MRQKQAPSGESFKRAKTLGEQIQDLRPMQTYKERIQAFEDAKKAKEEPQLYAVLGKEKILDLQSLEVAEKIAKKINASVWAMCRTGEEVEFLFPITLNK